VSQAPLLTAARASFRYPGRAAAVGPFDLTVRPGDLLLISGPSGCGKSTLARLLCGLIPHLYRGEMAGSVRLDTAPTASLPMWRLSESIGLVGQNPAAQLLAASVRQEVVFGLENLGLPRREIEARAATALARVGLAALAARDPRSLSGGEQQKLVLAAAGARQPRVLILDEPLSMLDTASARQVVEQLDALRRAGTAVVVLEHRTAPFAAVDGVRRLVLDGGADVDADLPELPRVPPFRLQVQGLGVSLARRQVLQDVDLTLASGQVVALVGANGAGKTTLLRALAGLQMHTGRISGLPGTARLGLCFQNPDAQLFNPTVRQELRFGLPACDATFYRQALRLLGLEAYEDTPPLLLSEGEKKRVAVAIALLRPGLCGLCLDEPTLGQDGGYRQRLGQILRRLAAAGYLCVVATHDLEWAAECADRLLVVHDGRVSARAASAAPDRAHGAADALEQAFA